MRDIKSRRKWVVRRRGRAAKVRCKSRDTEHRKYGATEYLGVALDNVRLSAVTRGACKSRGEEEKKEQENGEEKRRGGREK